MKQLRERANRRIALFGFAGLAVMLVMVLITGGAAAAAGLVIAGAPIMLTDREQALASHMTGLLEKEAEKLGKGYISAEKFNETFTAALKEYKGEISADFLDSLTASVQTKLNEYDLTANASFLSLSQAFEAFKNDEGVKSKIAGISGVVKEKWDAISGLSEGKEKSVVIDFSAAAGDISTTNVGNYPTTPIVDNPVTNYGVSRGSGREIIESVPSSNTESNTIIEVYESSKEGVPTYQGEGVTAPQVDYDWSSKHFPTERVSAFTRITKKALRSQAEVTRRIQRLVERDLFTAVASAMIAGTGVSPNISGMKSLGTAFSAAATGLEGKLPATLTASDVIPIIVAVETQAQKQNYFIDRHYLNPSEIALMQIGALGSAGEGTTQANLQRILAKSVPSNQIAQGEFVSVESEIMTNYYFDNLTISMSRDDAQDLKDGAVTTVAEVDHALVVNPVDSAGIVYGSFATAATDLNL